METCSVVLTFESVDEILWCDIQMKRLRQCLCMVPFVFNDLGFFLFFFFSVFGTLGS